MKDLKMVGLNGVSLLCLITLCNINLSSEVYIDIKHLEGRDLKILKYTKDKIKKTIIYSTDNLPITGALDNGNLIWYDYLNEDCEKIIVTEFDHSNDVLVAVDLKKSMFVKTKYYMKQEGEYIRMSEKAFKSKMLVLGEKEEQEPEKIFEVHVEKASTSKKPIKRKKTQMQIQAKPKGKKMKKTDIKTTKEQTNEESEIIISSSPEYESKSDKLSSETDESIHEIDDLTSDSSSESSHSSSKIEEYSSYSTSECQKSSSKISESSKSSDSSSIVKLQDDSEINLTDVSRGLLSDMPSDMTSDRSVTPVTSPIPTPTQALLEVEEHQFEPEIIPIEIVSESDLDETQNTQIQSDSISQTDIKRNKVGETETDSQMDKSKDVKKLEVVELERKSSIMVEGGSHSKFDPLEKRAFPTDLYHQDSSLEFEIRSRIRNSKDSKMVEKTRPTYLKTKNILDILNPKSNPRISCHYEINDGITSMLVRIKGDKVVNYIVEGKYIVHGSTKGKLLSLTVFSLFGEMKLLEIIMEESNGNYVRHYNRGVIFWVDSDAGSFEKSYLELKNEIKHISDVVLDISDETNDEIFYCRSSERNGIYNLFYYPKAGYHLKKIKCISTLVWSSETRRCLSTVLTMDKNDIIRLIKLELLDPIDNGISELHFFWSNGVFMSVSESLYQEILETELIDYSRIDYDSDDSDYYHDPSPIKQSKPTHIESESTHPIKPSQLSEATESATQGLVPETIPVELESDEEEIDVVNVSEQDIDTVTEHTCVESVKDREENVKIQPFRPIPIRPIPSIPSTISPIHSAFIFSSTHTGTKEMHKERSPELTEKSVKNVEKHKFGKTKTPKKPKVQDEKGSSGTTTKPTASIDIDSDDDNRIEEGAVSSEEINFSEGGDQGFAVETLIFPNALVEIDILENKGFIEEEYGGTKCRTFQPEYGLGFLSILAKGYQIWCGSHFEYSNLVKIYKPEEGPILGIFRTIKLKPFKINKEYFVELYNGKWAIINEQNFKILIKQCRIRLR